MPQKILEIKGDAWMKGLSLQTGLAVGGLFQTSLGFNPFEKLGNMQPSLAALQVTGFSVPINRLTSVNVSGTPYVYAQGAGKVYSILAVAPFTVTDITAQITTSDGTSNVLGDACIWRGLYIYSYNAKVFSNSIPLVLGSEVLILNSFTQASDIEHVLAVGPDGNLYVGNHNRVNGCTLEASINTPTVFALENGMNVRKILSDGTHLVILCDNNANARANRVNGTYKCQVYFWDMVKGQADVIWNIEDGYVVGGGFLDGAVYVKTNTGVYVCNFATSPKQIFSFLGNSPLTNIGTSDSQVMTSKTTLYFGEGQASGQKLNAYGSPLSSIKKIFHSPYIVHGQTYAQTAICKVGDYIFVATDNNDLYVLNQGTTRDTSTIQTAPIALEEPFTLSYIKVTLQAPLTSGQSVTGTAYTANGVLLSQATPQSYISAEPQRKLIFPVLGGAGLPTVFEDISLYIKSIGGAAIERVSVWGEPAGDDA